MKTSYTLLIAAFTAIALPGQAQDWNQFRGPSSNGVAPKSSHPSEWSADKNLKWRTALAGGGWSGPVVVGKKIFVTAAVSDKIQKPKNFDNGVRDPQSMGAKGTKAPDAMIRFEVACLDRETGKELWRKVAAERKPGQPVHPSNSFATETPASDGQRVYVYFGNIGLLTAYDLAGKELWKHELGSYPTGNDFGSGSSLSMADGRLFVMSDNETKSFLVAFDGKTGKELWRAQRTTKTSWATPFVWKNKLRTEVVACGAGAVTSYDPATGKELWKLGGVNGSFSSTPASDAEQIYFGNSGPNSIGPLYAVKAGASGDISLKTDQTSSESVAWFRTRSGPGMASPIAFNGYLYVLGQGTLTCHDIRTGEPIYKERLPKARTFAASPFVSGDKLYLLDETGQTFVVKTGPKFEIVGTNVLTETFWASSAVAGDALFLRGSDHLYCIRSR